MPAYCSVPITYARLIPNVCNVHQRMDKISHTSAYVGAIRCGVSTPELALIDQVVPEKIFLNYSNIDVQGVQKT